MRGKNQAVVSALSLLFPILLLLSLTGCPDPAQTSIAVTGVALDWTEASLKTSKTLQLTCTVSPADAVNQSVTWTSGDPAVGTVDAAGLVTAVAVGTATITVTTEDGGFTAACTVTVTDPDIYICGLATDNGTTFQYGYWKNGAWNQVSGINPSTLSVDDGIVYLGGVIQGASTTPAYWKADGTVVELSKLAEDKDGSVADIAVLDGVVYCCGTTSSAAGQGHAAVWIDGVRTDLTTVEESHASWIAVTSGAVYVVGDRRPSLSTFGYWRSTDGGASWTWMELAADDGPNNVSWRTYGGVVIDGSDVYVGGEKDADSTYKALYWKNGVIHMVHSGDFLESHSREIVLHQGTVYVGGEMGFTSSPTSIGVHDGGSGAWSVMGTDNLGYTVSQIGFGGLGVSSKDLFIAGTGYEYDTTNFYPYYWRNGSVVELQTPTGYPCGWAGRLRLVY